MNRYAVLSPLVLMAAAVVVGAKDTAPVPNRVTKPATTQSTPPPDPTPPVSWPDKRLGAIQPVSPLGKALGMMDCAAGQLRKGETGEPVQHQQRRVIELLTQLIEQAEQQEQQQSSSSCKKCRGKGCRTCKGAQAAFSLNPNSPMKKSMLPGGVGGVGELERSQRARPGEEWGKMRPEERDKILQSLRKNFPSRYRQLVEQYYKQLAKEH